jgi:hypothetical protein
MAGGSIQSKSDGVGSHRVGVQLDYEPEVGDTADERPPPVSEMREGEALPLARLARSAGPDHAVAGAEEGRRQRPTVRPRREGKQADPSGPSGRQVRR